MKPIPDNVARIAIAVILCLSAPVPGAFFLGERVAAQTNQPATEETTEDPPKDSPAEVEKAQPTEVPPEVDSPHSTMTTFLEAMALMAQETAGDAEQATAREQAVRCLDRSKTNAERAWILCAKLLGVLNRLGPYEPWTLWWKEDLDQRDVTEQVYFPHRRFDSIIASISGIQPKGRIVLAKQPDGSWLFSADTLAGIDGLFLNLEALPILVGVQNQPFGPGMWLRGHLPSSLKGSTVLTLETWQWLGLLVVVFGGLLVDLTIRTVLRILTGIMIARRNLSARSESIKRVVRPMGLLTAAGVWLLLLPLLDLGDRSYTILFTAVRVFTALTGTWAAWRLVDLLAEILACKAKQTKTKFDDVVIPLVRKSIKVFILGAGMVYCAVALRINVLPMLTGLGIGGLAFAFAAKDTIENFFGSIAVIVDRSFEVGDWVVIGSVEGTVEDVGFRSTRIRTFYNSLITIPNANLVRANVDNYGRRKYRRWKTNVGLQYDTPPEKIIAFTEGIRELVRSHPYTRKDYFHVRLKEFGASSLEVLLYIFHEVPDWSTELRERERLMLDILRIADQLGVRFAFPTQTLHLHRGAESAPEPMETPRSMTERRSMVRGIRSAHSIVAQQPWIREKPAPVVYQGGPSVIAPEDVADPDAHKVTEPEVTDDRE